MDPFLEREKELLRLNATLDSKCDSLDADESHSKLQSAGTKTKSNKGRNGKGVRGNGPAKGKLAKGANGTQSIKLKMSYEKVDVKSYYEELSKSIWRLDLMNANENETNGTEVLAAVCSMTTDVVGGDALIEQDVDKWKKIATDKIESTAQSIEGSTGSNGDVIGVKEMAAPKTLSNANPIEKFLNDFTVDPNKLNIDPSNTAMGDFSRGGGGSRTAANGYSHGSGETSPAECSLNGGYHFPESHPNCGRSHTFTDSITNILVPAYALIHRWNTADAIRFNVNWSFISRLYMYIIILANV